VSIGGEVYDSLKGNANLSRNRGVSWGSSLDLDSSDKPHIAWFDGSYVGHDEIMYVKGKLLSKEMSPQ
jgi:hypothetical protein